MSAGRKRLSWIEKHDAAIRELAWLGAFAGAPHPATLGAREEEAPSGGSSEAQLRSADVHEELTALRLRAERAEAAEAEATEALALARSDGDRLDVELTAVRAELEAVKDDAAGAARAMRDDAERELVRLAVCVAERVVGREIEASPEIIVGWAREAIAGSEIGERFEISVSSDIAKALEGAWGELAASVSEDPTLPAMTCEIEADGRVVSVSPGERLGLVAEQLGVEREAA